MASNPNRRKLLEELVPEGIIVSRKWLKQETGFSNHAIDNLVKSEQLKLLWKGLYTDYESDFTKPYTTILGYAVKDIEQIPVGMVYKEIPAGTYVEINTTGDVHDGIVIKEWIKIWNSNLQRKYTVDFECYTFTARAQDTKVDIFIAV